MTLDYLANINNFGDHIIRLYNFDKIQAAAFYEVFKKTIIEDRKVLDLSEILFIDRSGINLKIRIFPVDEGVRTNDGVTFYCDLTYNSLLEMLKLIEPFTKKETRTYQYLYDLDIETDFVFSPEGTWEM